MNQRKFLYVLPVIVFCFVVIFSVAFEKTRQGQIEVVKIHRAAELAIGSYLKDQRISGITYHSLPINYDKGRCIVGCRVDTTDENGVKRRTGFDVLLERQNQVWKAVIVKADKAK